MATDVREVTVKEVADALVASITVHGGKDAIGEAIQDAFARLGALVEDVGAGDGMPGMVVLEWGAGAEMTVEVFVPVASPFEPPEGVRVRTLEGCRVAAAVHEGPYDEVGAMYEALGAWVPAHGHAFAGPPRELYMNDPGAPGGTLPRSEVQFPIA
jgi:effector-binding domain-containing protein